MMTARDDTSTRPRKFNIMALLLAGSALGIAGCAQQRTEGYYDPPAESTVTDAQSQGSGAGYRTVLRAPSQVQIALKPDAPARPRASRPRPRKRPYHRGRPARARRRRQRRRLGRRCLGRGARAGPAGIHAQRRRAQPRAATADLHGYAALLLARHAVHGAARDADAGANGRWRGARRLESDAKQGAPVVEQGCWDATDERPSRVILLDGKGNVRAEFAAAANNVLRVRSIAGQTPNLNYNLTRQPDLDPIDELAKAAAPQCP